jgi:hypothetical protein
MAIEIQWRDENQVVLGTYEGPDLPMGVIDGAHNASTCLRFIDPYGDTVFNQRQLPVLIAELQVAAGGAVDAAPIRHVVAFLTRANEQLHTYVWFIGD